MKLIWRNYSYMYDRLLKCLQTDAISFVIFKVCSQILYVVLKTYFKKMWMSQPNTNPMVMAFGCFHPYLPHEIFDPFVRYFHHRALTLDLDTTPFWNIFHTPLKGQSSYTDRWQTQGYFVICIFLPTRSNRRILRGLNVEKTAV